MNSRTQKAKINSIVTLMTNVMQVIVGFIVRKLFIKYLGITYLGYNSVFSNILQMLNLADMGIGVAITSYLFKPLAENNKKQIASLMVIYKKLYSMMGKIVLIIGLIVSIFLKQLIPDATCSLLYLRLLFYINLIGTVSTYFIAYKRTLLIADQKSYITNIVDTVMYFFSSIIQIVMLVIYPSYVIYLILSIMKNIISNFILSMKTNKLYGKFKNDSDQIVIDEYKPKIYKYVKDVFVSRIGAVVYYSTDNIILSVMKGSILTGYLSNYTLITTQLNTVVVQVLNSLQSTFGNYIATTDEKDKQRIMTDNYFCLNFFIGNFCFISFSLLVQPFIKLFFGQDMLLDFSTAILLGLNLMLTFLIQLPSQVFIIYKLFRYDKPIIIVSAFLNIIISMFLVVKIGINGVLIGTTITSCIYLFSRFYIISKYVYSISYLYYLRKIFFYGVITGINLTITYYISNIVKVNNYFDFFIKIIIVCVIALINNIVMLSKTKEFAFLVNKVFKKYK